MALNYVTLTADLYDGQGYPLSRGTATFTPTAQLTDTTDHEIITQAGLAAFEASGAPPVIKLLATDNANITPAGWAWTVTFTGVPGNPAAFNFFLPFAGGATQNLSALAPVSAPSVLLGSNATGVTVYPSGDTTGVTDQADITAAEALGRTVYFAPGTFWVTGLTKQANTIWQGAGRLQTVIKLASGANTDVVQGANFATLTLSGSTAGIGGWGIRDLTIDGNKATQSGTSYGLRVYGYEFDIANVSIRNCLTDGLYTEWGAGFSASDGGAMESDITFIKIHDCGGNGWVNRGPHDTRAYDVTIFHNGTSSYGYWSQASNLTPTVAAGSNGVNVNTFTGSGTLNVTTTLGFPAASISAAQGSLTVATSGVNAVITYTGITATTFTGCTTVSGSGTLSTGGSVAPAGGGYTAAGALLEAVHVYGAPLYNYLLDTQTHLIDCIGEAAASGGAIVLARGFLISQILGGLYIVYAGEPAAGAGIQMGDAVNPCLELRVDTTIYNLAGTSQATAALAVVNDGGENSIDAFIYQPSGTAIWGTPANTSRYRVHANSATQAAGVNNSLEQVFGQSQQWVPPSAAKAFTITSPGLGDVINYNSTAGRWEHNNAMLDRWYAGSYANPTVEISGSAGTVALGAPAGSGVDTTLSRPAAGVFQSSGAFSAAGLTGGTAASRYAGAIASGSAPASGTFSTGDWMAVQAGGFIVCIAGGTQGTWVKVGALDGTAADIQNTGPQAAGSTGKAADAGHVHFSSGQYLCTPNAYAPASRTSLSVTTTTMAAWSTGNVCTNSFTAPASGSVIVTAYCVVQVAASGNTVGWALAAKGTVTPVIGQVITTQISGTTTGETMNLTFYVTGLTAGNSYQFDLLGAVTGSSTATIEAQGQTSTSLASAGAPVVMTVAAV